MKLLTTTLLGTLVLAGCASLLPPTPIATVDLKPASGSTVTGTTSFVQKGDSILVDARIKGLKPGAHGFHVHEKGDCSAPDAMSAGGHFNPTGESHGAPSAMKHHGGDLGNITADAEGNAVLTIALSGSYVSLAPNSPNSLIGRALVVHADPDDMMTQPTGNSGGRIACGVIALR